MANNIPDAPISSRAAWLGVEQAPRSDWIHVLSGAEKTELDSAICAYRRSSKALKEVTASEYPIPALGPAIAAWMRELDDGRGIMLVRGFPAADYSEAEAAFAYWLIGLHMGRPVPQNRKGEVLGHVRDDGAHPKQPGIRLYRTGAKLDFHTDGADIIGLLCLKRAKAGGLSRIASSVSVFNEVMRRRPDLVPLLFQGFFWDGKPMPDRENRRISALRFADTRTVGSALCTLDCTSETRSAFPKSRDSRLRRASCST